MAVHVTAVLNELHCVKESEDCSEPYIWPVLLWMDDTTIHNAGDEILGVKHTALGDARVVLKENMKVGESARIPFPLGAPAARLEGSMFTYLLLVVALFEKDETPQSAMWAGCKAFASELRRATAQRLLSLKAAVEQGDDTELQRLIAEIKAQVHASTKASTWDALTAWQKSRYLLGTLNLDDYVGVAFYAGKPGPATLDMLLKSDNEFEEYRITGSIEARPVAVDLCEAQAYAAAIARAAADGIEGQITAAKAKYQDASPAEKSTIKAQLERLNQDLDVATVALDE